MEPQNVFPMTETVTHTETTTDIKSESWTTSDYAVGGLAVIGAAFVLRYAIRGSLWAIDKVAAKFFSDKKPEVAVAE